VRRLRSRIIRNAWSPVPHFVRFFPSFSPLSSPHRAAVAAAFNWIANTLVALYFRDVNNALGNLSFLPFCGWLALAFVFTIVYVPETKGKSPAELLRWFNKGYAPAAGGDDAY
jgi:hypothetical protein